MSDNSDSKRQELYEYEAIWSKMVPLKEVSGKCKYNNVRGLTKQFVDQFA